MAQVSLQINGYPYVIGCADGEEEHLRALAAGLDKRIEDIKTATGLTGEGRLLVMAALVLSDELHDLRERTGEPPAPAQPVEKPAAKPSRRLKSAFKRAEELADLAEAPEPAQEETFAVGGEADEPAENADPETLAEETAPAENIAAPHEQA